LIRDYVGIADAVRSMRRYLEVTYNSGACTRRSAIDRRQSSRASISSNAYEPQLNWLYQKWQRPRVRIGIGRHAWNLSHPQ
jgi:hypothetical protein